MDFPILHDPGSIDMLLRTVSKSDPPKAVDNEYLQELGFKREMDEDLLKLLDFLDFIDELGHPTVNWVNYSDTNADCGVLRESVRKAYHDLFEKYPKACELEGAQLMKFFKESTGASENKVAYMILTFKVLCDLSGMGEEMPEATEEKKDSGQEAEKKVKKVAGKEKSEGRKEPEEEEKEIAEEETLPEEDADKKAAEGISASTPLRISLNIDLDQDSDPELRDLVMKLIRKQLEL
jgi:hypothetical protein